MTVERFVKAAAARCEPPPGAPLHPVAVVRREDVAALGLTLVLLAGLRCTSSSTSSSASLTPASLDGLVTNVVRQVDPSVVFIQTANGLGSGEVYNDQGDRKSVV